MCTFKFPFLRKLSPDEDVWMGGGVVGPWKGSFSSQWDDIECMKQLKSILFIIWSKIVRLKAAAFYVWVVSFEVTNYYGFSYFCLPDLCMVFSLFLVTNWYNDLLQFGLSFCVWMDTHALSDWFYRFLLTETALHSGCPCIGLSPPKMCRTSLSSLGGGGPMKGFIFKSMRWYRMHEAVEINLFIIWSKTVRLKTAALYVWVAILRFILL